MAGTTNFASIAALVFVGNYSSHDQSWPLLRASVMTVAVLFWSTRLTIHLIWRRVARILGVEKSPTGAATCNEDPRMVSLRGSWWKFSLWCLHRSLYVWTVSLPCTLANALPSQPTPFSRYDHLGLALWVLGCYKLAWSSSSSSNE